MRASQESPSSLWYTAAIAGCSATGGGRLPRFAHHYKCHCIENYWCCYGGCYSCAINKHSASKRHSRINSKDAAFWETKITPCWALEVPSANCLVPAVTSQGPCLPVKGKKHVWIQKPRGSSLSLQVSDSEQLGPTWKYTVSSSAWSPKSANPLRAMKIPGKIWAPVWTLLALLRLWGLFSSWQVPFWEFQPCQVLCSVRPDEVYTSCKWTKTYKWVISLRSRSMAERFGLSQGAYFAWMYLINLDEKVHGAWESKGREGCDRSRMPMFCCSGYL